VCGYRDAKSPPFRWHFNFNTSDKMMVKIKIRPAIVMIKVKNIGLVSQREGIHLLKHKHITNKYD
jgi:hypothetical protein